MQDGQRLAQVWIVGGKHRVYATRWPCQKDSPGNPHSFLSRQPRPPLFTWQQTQRTNFARQGPGRYVSQKEQRRKKGQSEQVSDRPTSRHGWPQVLLATTQAHAAARTAC